MALPQEHRDSVPSSPFETDSDVIELSDEELRAMVDANAREYLGISGEELLQRLRAKKPLTDESGNPVPAWRPVAMLAALLLDN
jgi:hypothetical protein